MTRTALVTGGNRGIGLEVCRLLAEKGLRVVLTSRDPGLGEAAAATLQATLPTREVLHEPLDLASEASVLDCAGRLRQKGVEVDVLVNNGAVYPAGRLLTIGSEILRETFDINLFGAAWACRAFVPGMLKRDYGRVVNVTSGLGSISGGLGGPAAYSLTKAALNALTIRLASEVRGDVKVNSACPGWVATRMGGPGAPIPAEQAADTIVWLATLPEDGPHGGNFRDRESVPW